MTRPPERPDSAAAPGDAPEPRPSAVPPALWVSTTYFAEGFPYSVVNSVADILWKDLGASYGAVGLTSLFHLPWNLKLLWGPWLDRYETKRWWLLLTELLLCFALAGVLAVSLAGGPAWLALSLLFTAMAVVSATHDIAIDGYYLELLDEYAQSRYVGFRAPAYKLASLVFGPLIVLKDATSWPVAFAVVLGVMASLTGLHALILPRAERRRRPFRALVARLASRRSVLVVAASVLLVVLIGRGFGVSALSQDELVALGRSVGQWFALGLVGVLVALLASLPWLRRIAARDPGRDSEGYAAAFLDFVDQPRVLLLLLFVMSFRTGESFLVKMKYPFMSDAMHMTASQYGYANLLFGVLASFLGTALGGYLISRQGLRRWIWPFVIAQNVLNLVFMGLALSPVTPSLFTLTGAICIEQFGAGLGTAVFMVYLMRCCHPDHRAAHMAILTALMSVSFTVAGTVSGFLVESLGFAQFFGLTFLATVPGMLLIPFLPNLDGHRGHRRDERA